MINGFHTFTSAVQHGNQLLDGGAGSVERQHVFLKSLQQIGQTGEIGQTEQTEVICNNLINQIYVFKIIFDFLE